jgi:hypothetical protein
MLHARRNKKCIQNDFRKPPMERVHFVDLSVDGEIAIIQKGCEEYVVDALLMRTSFWHITGL